MRGVWGGVDQHPVDGVVETAVDPVQVRDVGRRGGHHVERQRVVQLGGPVPPVLRVALHVRVGDEHMLLAPGLVHEAQARNTALVVFMLPPLPVANAITIGSRFFLSFIGFSLFRYVGIRFFGILVSWFFGISVYAASHADRDGKRSEEAALDQALRHGFGRKEQRSLVAYSRRERWRRLARRQ